MSEGGKIVAIGEILEAPTHAEVIDVDDQYVLPCGIDPDIHTDIGSEV